MPTPVPDGYKPGNPLLYGGFAGVRNDVQPERMATADLIAGNNINIDNSGEVSRRKGRRQLVSGAAHSVWSDGRQCLFVIDDTLKRLNADFSTTPILSGLAPSRYLAYESEGDRTYWSNGITSGVIEANASRPWGIPSPRFPILTSDAPGWLVAGRYQAVLTQVAEDGRESGGSSASTVIREGEGGIRVRFPVSSLITNLYLSPADGDDLFLAAEIEPGVSDYIFSGSEQDYGRPLDKRYLIDCPGGHIVRWYAGRLYVVNGSLIYPSQPMAYELFDPYDAIDIDGSEIAVFAPVANGIFVGTEQRVVFLSGSGPEDFKINARIEDGAVPGSLAYARGSDLLDGQLFANQNAPIFSTQQGLFAGTADGQLIPLSSPRYRHGKASRSAAVAHRDAGFQQYLAIFTP